MKYIRYKKSSVSGQLLVKTNISKYLLQFLKIFKLDVEPYVRSWLEDFVDEETMEVVSLERHEVVYDKLGDLLPVSYVVRAGAACWIECMGNTVNFTFKISKPDIATPYVLEFDVEGVKYPMYIEKPVFRKRIIVILIQTLMEEIDK